jgi:hypothetical protein
MSDEPFEGGRWVVMREIARGGSWTGSIDVHRPAPRLQAVVEMAQDWLAAPHNPTRRDVFMLECNDAAQRLINVVRDPDEEEAQPFVADFLAMLVLEMARREAHA